MVNFQINKEGPQITKEDSNTQKVLEIVKNKVPKKAGYTTEDNITMNMILAQNFMKRMNIQSHENDEIKNKLTVLFILSKDYNFVESTLRDVFQSNLIEPYNKIFNIISDRLFYSEPDAVGALREYVLKYSTKEIIPIKKEKPTRVSIQNEIVSIKARIVNYKKIIIAQNNAKKTLQNYIGSDLKDTKGNVKTHQLCFSELPTAVQTYLSSHRSQWDKFIPDNGKPSLSCQKILDIINYEIKCITENVSRKQKLIDHLNRCIENLNRI